MECYPGVTAIWAYESRERDPAITAPPSTFSYSTPTEDEERAPFSTYALSILPLPHRLVTNGITVASSERNNNCT